MVENRRVRRSTRRRVNGCAHGIKQSITAGQDAARAAYRSSKDAAEKAVAPLVAETDNTGTWIVVFIALIAALFFWR